jgi:predicted sulfurtransferase
MKATIMLLVLLSQVAAPPDGAPRITQREFRTLVAANNVVIVDTRNVDAYALGHIPGAILLPLEGQASWPPEYEKTAEMLQMSRKPVVTYCA